MKEAGMLVISLRGVNVRLLGVMGRTKIFLAVTISFRVTHEQIYRYELSFLVN